MRLWKKKRSDEQSPIVLAEEAVHLLRTSPVSTVLAYYIGAVPFMLGLMFFWTDMCRNAFAHRACAHSALRLALLFVWMKAWRTVFASQLMARLRDMPPPSWNARQLLRMTAIQAAVQPLSFVALPVSILMTLPFAWAYAMFQNVGVLGDGETGLRASLRRSWSQAILWPRQNHIIVWLLCPWLLAIGLGVAYVCVSWITGLLEFQQYSRAMNVVMWYGVQLLMTYATIPLSPFGFAIAGNVSMAILFGPELLRSLFGMDAAMALTQPAGVFNSTFLIVVFSLSYLFMDPVACAAYALRCFHGDALHTGEDLSAELRAIKRSRAPAAVIILLAALAFGAPLAASADNAATAAPAARAPVAPANVSDASVPPPELDRAVSEVLARPEYGWRMPREPIPQDLEEEGWLGAFIRAAGETIERGLKAVGRHLDAMLKWIEEKLDKFDRWLNSRRRQHADTGSGSSGWITSRQILFFVVLAVLLSALAVVALRLWRLRKRGAKAEALPVQRVVPDLTDENVAADDLPSDEWCRLGAELLDKGEFRLALRAFHLACLAYLGHIERISIAKHKSNRDYMRELARKAHDQPDLLRAFGENVGIVERTWYGRHPVTPEMIEAFAGNRGRIIPARATAAPARSAGNVQ